jgi:hypothetical protein
MTVIRLVEGVVGGFIQAVPRKQIIIETEEGIVRIEKYVKSSAEESKDGYLFTQNSAPETVETNEEIESFVKGLSLLPTEEPIGCQDIYKQDISCFVESKGIRWANCVNQGCDIAESKVTPTQAQIEQFKSIIQKISHFADSRC